MKKYDKIYIEITNRCNLNCSFCPKTGRRRRAMTADEFEQIAKKVQGRAVNYYLHVMGEPTAHPQLKEILDICSKYGMTVNITTNGTLLDRAGDDILNAGARMVAVSMHSFEANTLTKPMREYLDVIMDFCRKAIGTKTKVELRLWNFDRNSIYDKNKLNYQIIEYLQNALKPDFPLFENVEKSLIEMENSNHRKLTIRIRDDIFLGMSEHFEWPDINRNSEYCSGFCYGLRRQLGILADGEVIPCCLDSEGVINLGNLFESNFDDIINSGRAKALYDGFTNGKPVERLCQTCGYMNMHRRKQNT